MSESDLTPVSVTQGDRVLTGVGADPEQLAETMERHAPDEPVASPVPTEPTEPKVTRGQKRYSELTSERDKAKNEAAALVKERDELKQRLDAASRPQAPAAPVTPDVPKETPLPATKALLAKMPAALKTFDEYVIAVPDAEYEEWRDARNLWLYQQQTPDLDAVVRRRIEADTASRTYDETVNALLTRARQTFSDFDAVRTTGPGSTIDLASTPEQSASRVRAIIQRPDGEHLIYAIAKDADLARKLAAMSDIEFGSELGRLAPQAAVASPASTAPTGSVTPPAPYQPVGAGSKTTAPPLADLPKKSGYDFDKSGYRERRAAERGVTRRR